MKENKIGSVDVSEVKAQEEEERLQSNMIRLPEEMWSVGTPHPHWARSAKSPKDLLEAASLPLDEKHMLGKPGMRKSSV